MALPLSSTISGTTPGSGRVADPGLVGVAPGMGEIMMAPVSVCHHVSTIGQALLANDFVIPLPGRRIDRFTHRTKQPQRSKVPAFRPLIALPDK